MYCVFYHAFCFTEEHPILNPFAKAFDSIETAKVWVQSDRKKARKFSEERGLNFDYEDGNLGKNDESAFASLVVSAGTAGEADYKQYILRWEIVPLEL